MSKNSMLHWWPLIKDLDVPMPRTEIVVTNDWDVYAITDGGSVAAIESQLDEILAVADKLGYPLFMRTDHTSGKHDWQDSCYLSSRERISHNITGLINYSAMADLTIEAIVLREYIPMASVFTAFNGMPMNPERRYFIRDGIIECHHPYWIEQAILEGNSKCMLTLDEQGNIIGKEYIAKGLPDDWRELLAGVNKETEEELVILRCYAELVAESMDGYWSVDFCQAASGMWYLIDIATGERSWHPECEWKVEMW